MKHVVISLVAGAFLAAFTSCGTDNVNNTDTAATTTTDQPAGAGQSGVQDDRSQKNVVQVAIASKYHSTLVKAVQQAELVDALSNAGPFTVFAPVNAAFEKLPAGTLDDLMKDENKEQLADILQYHVFVGVIKTEMMQDGQKLGQVNGGNVTVSKQGDVITLNNKAKIVATVPASNGVVYVIDNVLLSE